MAPKKKKSSKKSKKSKEPKPEEEKKPEDEEPEYIDPAKSFPEVEVEVKLATPPVDFLSKSPFSTYHPSRIYNCYPSHNRFQRDLPH